MQRYVFFLKETNFSTIFLGFGDKKGHFFDFEAQKSGKKAKIRIN
jgi:hypothetical protein